VSTRPAAGDGGAPIRWRRGEPHAATPALGEGTGHGARLVLVRRGSGERARDEAAATAAARVEEVLAALG
jgi:hypothetical protein